MKKIVLAVAVVGLIYGFGYYNANAEWELKYKEFQLKSEQEYNKLLEEKMIADEETRKRVRIIQEDFTKALENQKVAYEKVISDIHNNFHPDGVYDSTSSSDGVPRPSGDPNGVVCYAKPELQRKIAKTMAIAKDADELALRYNALLKIVKGEQK